MEFSQIGDIINGIKGHVNVSKLIVNTLTNWRAKSGAKKIRLSKKKSGQKIGGPAKFWRRPPKTCRGPPVRRKNFFDNSLYF